MSVLAFALAVLIAAPDSLPSRVNGRVLDARTGRGVRSAIVQIAGNAGQRTTFTGSDGSYLFDNVAAAEYVLSVIHPGYDNGRIRITIRQGAALTIDMPLEPVPLPVPGFTVIGDVTRRAVNRSDATGSADLRARLEQLGRTGRQAAGALGDLVLADIAREPRPDDPGGRQPHVLYVWGSSAERGRVTLDGATINAPLHLGGILPPLDPELLARAELRTAGASPRFDGGTSYVMDFATRGAARDSVRGRADLDLLATGATFEAPLGDEGGIVAGARRVNDGLVENLLGRRFGYGYADGLASVRAAGPAGRLSATGFATREAIYLPRDLGEDMATWHNLAGAVTWETGRLRTTATCSRGVVDLPLLSAPGGHLRATADRCAAGSEHTWLSNGNAFTVGFEVEHLGFDQRASADAEPSEDALTTIACTSSLPCADAATTWLSPWTEAAWQPSSRVSVRAGMRAGYETAGGTVAALPRLSVSLLDDAATTALTFSAGRFSQTNTIETGIGGLAAASLGTVIGYATQFELQLARRSARSAFAGSLLLHRFEGGPGVSPWTAPGAELSWAWTAGPWTATLGYSVLGRRRSPLDTVAEYQQMAAASVSTTAGRVSFGLSSAYGRGMPLTSVVLEQPTTELASADGETRNSPFALDDDRSYFRVDARVGAEWTTRFLGKQMHLTPYARLVNGLSRRDALFYYQEAGPPGEPQPLAALASLPVLGLRIEF